MADLDSGYQNRFGGMARLCGQVGQKVLQSSHVIVVGIGGVGSWVAESLARSGIGQITLIDLDDVCITNTNRQIHALRDTVGQSKVQVMAERIALINPDCKVNQVEEFADRDNLFELFDVGADYLVDAIDAASVKAAMIAWAKRNKLPVITVGGAGGQLDPLQVVVTDLSKTIQDPLSAKVRSLLRRHYNFTRNTKRRFAVECVSSTEQLQYPQADGSVCGVKSAMEDGVRLDCAGGFGAASFVTATFGMVAASRVVNKLIQKTK